MTDTIRIELDYFIDSYSGRMIPDYENMTYELEQKVEGIAKKYNQTIDKSKFEGYDKKGNLIPA